MRISYTGLGALSIVFENAFNYPNPLTDRNVGDTAGCFRTGTNANATAFPV